MKRPLYPIIFDSPQLEVQAASLDSDYLRRLFWFNLYYELLSFGVSPGNVVSGSQGGSRRSTRLGGRSSC
jgi:hypothetical protein